jgi:hypothetical protein
VLEELVEGDLRDGVALQLDLDPHAALVAVVLDRLLVRGDLGEHLVVRELRDLLQDAELAALLHAVRKLGDDDRRPSAAKLLDVRPRAHDDASAARPVGVADPRAPDDDPAGRKVRPLYLPHERVDVRARVVDQRHDGVDHLAEVVRRDVRGHPHCDPRRAVDEQVRDA